MASNRHWLIDSVFHDNIITLSYLDSQGHLIQTTHPFNPYFYAETENTETSEMKRDLFLGTKRQVSKVPWDSQHSFAQRWEQKIDPAMSFIYDHNYRFGTVYQQEGEKFISMQGIPDILQQKFNTQFESIKKTDPLKFEFLEDFFKHIMHPIPDIRLLPRELGKRYNDQVGGGDG